MLERVKDAVREWAGPPESVLLEYSYEDLHAATEGFRASRRLGAGTAGAVYRGELRGGAEVAVKVLGGASDAEGFEEELRVLSRFRHPNLVTLMGWGLNGDHRYLVYELLEGGDVGKKLWQSKKCTCPFSWQERIRVACDASCGLSHMVNSQPQAFHRDIKPANIILDAKGTAKMADFGLADTINCSPGRGHLQVEYVSGTPGYTCPTMAETGCVSEHSEVFSFGMLLLELLVNLAPAQAGPKGNLVYPLCDAVQPWAPGSRERLLAALDPQAQWPYPVAEELGELGLCCVADAGARPPFEHLVGTLRRLCRGGDGGSAIPGQVQPLAVYAPVPSQHYAAPTYNGMAPASHMASPSNVERQSSPTYYASGATRAIRPRDEGDMSLVQMLFDWGPCCPAPHRHGRFSSSGGDDTEWVFSDSEPGDGASMCCQPSSGDRRGRRWTPGGENEWVIADGYGEDDGPE